LYYIRYIYLTDKEAKSRLPAKGFFLMSKKQAQFNRARLRFSTEKRTGAERKRARRRRNIKTARGV